MSALEYSHERAQHTPREWTLHRCKICKFKTTSLFFMRNHAERHLLELTPFNCELNNVEVYFCKDCNFTTALSVVLKAHIRTSHLIVNERVKVTQKYTCEKCRFPTYSSLNWLKHVTHCSAGTQYPCETCDFRTKYRNNLRRHKMYRHLEDGEIQWFECHTCGHKNKRKDHLRLHIEHQHLRTKVQPHKVDYGAKLKDYLKNTKNIDEYECNKCDYRTKHRTDLTKHVVNRHLEDHEIQWFECHICGHKTKRKYYLRRHVQNRHTHVDEIRWFRCDKCAFKAKYKQMLKQHIENKH